MITYRIEDERVPRCSDGWSYDIPDLIANVKRVDFRRQFEEVSSDNVTLRQRVAEPERAAVALNADKMAFMREFVLLSVPTLDHIANIMPAVARAEDAWSAIVEACEVKP